MSWPCRKCGEPMRCYNTKPLLTKEVRRRNYVCTNDECGERLMTYEVVEDSVHIEGLTK
jgi:transcriptional regulator NrdR family protein